MAHGGKRDGAGRRAGARNSRTTEIVEAMVESGEMTPLEYLLAVMRDIKLEDAKRIDAAKAAAPYCHAKRVPVDSKGEDSSGITVILHHDPDSPLE